MLFLTENRFYLLPICVLGLQAPVVTIILICEVSVKLFALGPRLYFGNAWHDIGFAGVRSLCCYVVFTSILPDPCSQTVVSLVAYMWNVPLVVLLSQLLRLLRFFELLQRISHVRSLFHAAWVRLAPVVSILLTLALLILSYAVAGTLSCLASCRDLTDMRM